MAASWKQLANLQGVDTTIVAWVPNSAADNASFDESVVAGLNCHLFSPRGTSKSQLQTIAAEAEPDVVVIAGWIERDYVELARQLQQQKGVAVVMGLDTPWLGTLKQQLTRVVRRRQVRFVDHVITAGKRASDHARRLGFSKSQITEGVYAWDEDAFAGVALSAKCEDVEITPSDQSRENGFLYVGRYVPVKGLTTLLEAYEQYRKLVPDPWQLTCCGTGPLEPKIASTPGVKNLGFQAPSNLPNIMAHSQAFVFPSTYEPWGVALAEAMGAGLPAISTNSCGAALDLIEHNQNGRMAPAFDAGALTESMVWLHNHPNRAELGRRAMSSAARFTSAAWATRWYQVFQQIRSENDEVT